MTVCAFVCRGEKRKKDPDTRAWVIHPLQMLQRTCATTSTILNRYYINTYCMSTIATGHHDIVSVFCCLVERADVDALCAVTEQMRSTTTEPQPGRCALLHLFAYPLRYICVCVAVCSLPLLATGICPLVQWGGVDIDEDWEGGALQWWLHARTVLPVRMELGSWWWYDEGIIVKWSDVRAG